MNALAAPERGTRSVALAQTPSATPRYLQRSTAVLLPRAVVLLAVGFVPAVLAGWGAPATLTVVLWNVLVAALCAVDYLRAPRREALSVERHLPGALLAGAANAITVVLEGRVPMRGELRDCPPPQVRSDAHRQTFQLSGPHPTHELRYLVTPPTRGRLGFGDIWVRLEGPWRLCARQLRYGQTQAVKVLPELAAHSKEALLLARASEQGSRAAPRSSEGRLFESLREYRPGDSPRDVDWKASARRSSLVVREYRPEKNQPVFLLLDCGRQMAGMIRGRRKLDFAVDAALRLAEVSLLAGDAVGLLAFGRSTLAHLPVRTGPTQLRGLVQALYPLEAELEESDYAGAVETLLRRHHRRSLLVVFTDLQDPHAAKALVDRTLALRPRHLPLVLSLMDEDVAESATGVPTDVLGAYVRPVAQRLEEEVKLLVRRLDKAGAVVIRARAEELGPSLVRSYLDIKARGLL